MRVPLLALAAALALASPSGARASLDLRLEVFEGGGAAPARLSLDVPDLPVRDLPVLAARHGGGGGVRTEPGLCLVLGIIPGFGLGHALAGSPQWVIWLIADIVIFALWPGGFFLYDHGSAYNFLGLLVLVERVFEGISAFQAAGGGPVFRGERGWDAPSPAEVALPVGARGSPFR
jgi:hypothetical protein